MGKITKVGYFVAMVLVALLAIGLGQVVTKSIFPDRSATPKATSAKQTSAKAQPDIREILPQAAANLNAGLPMEIHPNIRVDKVEAVDTTMQFMVTLLAYQPGDILTDELKGEMRRLMMNGMCLNPKIFDGLAMGMDIRHAYLNTAGEYLHEETFTHTQCAFHRITPSLIEP